MTNPDPRVTPITLDVTSDEQVQAAAGRSDGRSVLSSPRVVHDHVLAAYRAHRGVRDQIPGAEPGAVGHQWRQRGRFGQRAQRGRLDPAPTAASRRVR